ncbi:stretch-activated cation channel mid1 [Orbilia brochopaga]|uniref:Stretch-activated cation channel mid1 n=1 Tax=Orbilia brochopaga TaxID=3140254 RepID=A0AAV9V2R9_9PEZI
MAFKISCPRLTPLQSRVAASSFATVVLITILVLWTLPPSAYSQSLPDLGGHHIHHVHSSSPHHLADNMDDRPGGLNEGLVPVGNFYNPVMQSTEDSKSWADADSGAEEGPRHDLLPGLVEKRQNGPFLNSLVRDTRRNLNIEIGEVQLWGFDTEQLFADAGKGDAGNVVVDVSKNVRVRSVYFNFNTCWQPTPSNTTTSFPPRLTLYASNTTANKDPGPSADPRQQIVVPVIEGFANVTVNASSTVYISVVAPNITAGSNANFSGFYNYDIIASTAQSYYGWYKQQNLYLIDSDSSNALLISGNETSYDNSVNVSTIVPPYTFFAHPANDTSLTGLRRSWCGLSSRALLSAANLNGDISMTRRGLGSKVKEQIYLKGLQPNMTYNVWLAKPNNETDGGFVYSAVNLTTKSDGNCRVIYDLEFCSEVAYAVPTNDTVFADMPRLARFYDTYASSWYANFSYSLQQVQCNTTADREYSHLRSCADCDAAYKTWLCATTIPRCADYSSNATFLAVRERGAENKGPRKIFLDDGRIIDIPTGVNNSDASSSSSAAAPAQTSGVKAASRNVLIDEVVSPGPYKEIKPCMDLCWSLVQSCPASLGFSCPSGSRGEQSYGWRSDDGDITCSYLGAAYFLSGAERAMARVWLAVLVAAAAMVGMVL